MDDDDADDVGFGQPLPPEDRLWRHPSEFGAAAAAATPLRAAGADPGRLWGVALVAGLAGAVLATGVVAAQGGLGTRVVEHEVVERVAMPAKLSRPLAAGDRGVADVTADVSPAVVRVEVDVDGEQSSGSGVLFRDDGYVLTSGYVISDADNIAITLYDGRRLTATIVGIDKVTDVAVVKVDGERFPTAVLGSAIDLVIGEPVMALGCEAGSEIAATVTTGVVSALGRQVATDDQPLHDMVQTDAPIARGISGGPLVDSSGAVIGITTAANESERQLGFAIPIDLAHRVAVDLISSGRAHHVWLGIAGHDLDLSSAKVAGVEMGALVNNVAAASPAALAGLKADDIIVAVDGHKVTSMSGVVIALRTHRPGDEVSIGYVRAGKWATMTVMLVERSG
jgi:S1-C subfamily serine protease